MNDTPKITALAITFNEAQHLPGFLSRLDFVDEIVIVDSYSTDETITIAKAHPKVRLVQRTFDNFSSQKNFAISQARNAWVLFFDPDEEITPDLTQELIAAVNDPTAAAYTVQRQLYFMGRKIRFSGLQNDWVIRLFRADKARYNGNLVHETLEVDGEVAKLNSRVPHYTYTNFDAYTAKMHRYAKLQAEMLHQKGVRPSLFHFLFRPFYRFWHQYLLRLGFLDGKEGFILAYLSAFSVFKRYTNLWLLYRKIE